MRGCTNQAVTLGSTPHNTPASNSANLVLVQIIYHCKSRLRLHTYPNTGQKNQFQLLHSSLTGQISIITTHNTHLPSHTPPCNHDSALPSFVLQKLPPPQLKFLGFRIGAIFSQTKRPHMSARTTMCAAAGPQLRMCVAEDAGGLSPAQRNSFDHLNCVTTRQD